MPIMWKVCSSNSKKSILKEWLRNGFEDGYLYNNDQLMKLNNVELKEFEKLKKIIGSNESHT
jgi:hypothetical protein